MILPSGFDSVEAYTTALSAFLTSELVSLITAQIHNLDILPRPTADRADNAGDWARLPADWRAWFDSVAAQDELQEKLDDVRVGRDCPGRPATLTAFLNATRALCLPRQFVTPSPNEGFNLARQSMSVKKSHEVQRFAALVGRFAAKRAVRKIIDIGAGQGYLTRTLATMHPSFSFLAIDGSAAQLAGSQRLSPELSHQISYLPAYIRSSTTARDEIEAWLGAEDALVIGLHCCGCLTDDILAMFAQTQRIRGAVVAGCCFNHLRLESHEATIDGAKFPTSARLRGTGVRLSSTALMAACQDTTNWASGEDAPAAVSRRQLARKKTHYRRILTALLASPGMPPTSDRLPLGAIALSLTDAFPAYAERALSKLGLMESLDRDAVGEAARSLEAKYGDWRWEGRGRAVEALAKACGAVVESVIALDRYWALNEVAGISVDVVAAWDYALSPRNLVIVAAKET